MSSSKRAVSPGWILALVSGAQFMVILDLAIVNVALPSIQQDVGASQSDLQWVVIAYGLTLGGFLLLGGRMADRLGRPQVLAVGLAVFGLASLGAGVSGSLGQLVAFRALQGLGGAMASPAALSIVTSTFSEGAARNKALGIFGAVGGSAATVGAVAGGALTEGPGWEWVFLINVPIGVALAALVLTLVPASPVRRAPTDVLGAVSVTGGLMAIVYAINRSVDHGWASSNTLGVAGGGIALLALFVAVEARASSPLVPLAMFRRRNLTAANVVAVLLWGAFFATIFQGTLFMQQVMGYSAIETGLAWLAATASSLVMAGVVTPLVLGRLGAAKTLVVGQVFMTAGLLYLARAPIGASYWGDLFPGFLGLGLGIGFSMVAVQVSAFSGIEESVSGLAGGMVETAREIGGALGVAVVATAAVARADVVLGSGDGQPGAELLALTEGYQRASLVAAGMSLAAGLAAGLLLLRAERASSPQPAPDLDGELATVTAD
jgi:EmrB/QacA subfamily drug resistance transporter